MIDQMTVLYAHIWNLYQLSVYDLSKQYIVLKIKKIYFYRNMHLGRYTWKYVFMFLW